MIVQSSVVLFVFLVTVLYNEIRRDEIYQERDLHVERWA